MVTVSGFGEPISTAKQATDEADMTIQMVLAEHKLYQKLISSCSFRARKSQRTSLSDDSKDPAKSVYIESDFRVRMKEGDAFVEFQSPRDIRVYEEDATPGLKNTRYEFDPTPISQRLVISQGTVAYWSDLEVPLIDVYEEDAWKKANEHDRFEKRHRRTFSVDPRYVVTEVMPGFSFSRFFEDKLAKGQQWSTSQDTDITKPENLVLERRGVSQNYINALVYLHDSNFIIACAQSFPAEGKIASEYRVSYMIVDGIPFPEQMEYVRFDKDGTKTLMTRVRYEDVEINPVDNERIDMNSLDFPDGTYLVWHLPSSEQVKISKNGTIEDSTENPMSIRHLRDYPIAEAAKP
ncbi:MAG: hypothetical protein AMXMBFR84_44870 [Candidatus Hydrogenedentota bacterium]